MKCRNLSVRIARSFNCRGIVRIDYKLIGEEFFTIEINTVPGMTAHSIVPQQAAPLGITKTDLIDFMIDWALRQ
jgi:D-alanine-D-alanine ligase